jgi:hypothetical protein
MLLWKVRWHCGLICELKEREMIIKSASLLNTRTYIIEIEVVCVAWVRVPVSDKILKNLKWICKFISDYKKEKEPWYFFKKVNEIKKKN